MAKKTKIDFKFTIGTSHKATDEKPQLKVGSTSRFVPTCEAIQKLEVGDWLTVAIDGGDETRKKFMHSLRVYLTNQKDVSATVQAAAEEGVVLITRTETTTPE